MKVNVTLNSLYKYAIIEENYEIDLSEKEKLDNVLEYLEVNELSDATTNQLGSLVLNGFGEVTNKSIMELENCKQDNIVDVQIMEELKNG